MSSILFEAITNSDLDYIAMLSQNVRVDKHWAELLPVSTNLNPSTTTSSDQLKPIFSKPKNEVTKKWDESVINRSASERAHSTHRNVNDLIHMIHRQIVGFPNRPRQIRPNRQGKSSQIDVTTGISKQSSAKSGKGKMRKN